MADFDRSEDFLNFAHARFPGMTPKLFDIPLDASLGPATSYDRLVEIIPWTSHPLCVLDLACGDGFLCEELLAKRGNIETLLGIDASPYEIEAARYRLQGRPVDLRQARAQSLPLANACMDYVLSHMALMLLDPLDEAVREIARVLRPGGIFAAIVNARGVEGSFVEVYRGHYQRIARDHRLASFRQLGDPRARSADGLKEVFGTANGFEPVHLYPCDLILRQTPDAVADIMVQSYEAYCLSDAGLRELHQLLTRDFRRFADGDGLVRCTMSLRQVIVRRL